MPLERFTWPAAIDSGCDFQSLPGSLAVIVWPVAVNVIGAAALTVTGPIG